MAFCNYEQQESGHWRCVVCKDETSTPRAKPPRKVCGPPAEHLRDMQDANHRDLVANALASVGESPESMGLGDLVSAGLDSVGLTKERMRDWLGTDCRCKDRQEALNKLGRRIVAFIRGG